MLVQFLGEERPRPVDAARAPVRAKGRARRQKDTRTRPTRLWISAWSADDNSRRTGIKGASASARSKLDRIRRCGPANIRRVQEQLRIFKHAHRTPSPLPLNQASGPSRNGLNLNLNLNLFGTTPS